MFRNILGIEKSRKSSKYLGDYLMTSLTNFIPITFISLYTCLLPLILWQNNSDSMFLLCMVFINVLSFQKWWKLQQFMKKKVPFCPTAAIRLLISLIDRWYSNLRYGFWGQVFIRQTFMYEASSVQGMSCALSYLFVFAVRGTLLLPGPCVSWSRDL